MRASSHYYTPWTFLIFAAIPISCGYESDDRHQNNGNGPGGRVELTGLYPGPYFDLERNQHNISSHVGTHAYLPCYVKQLGNKRPGGRVELTGLYPGPYFDLERNQHNISSHVGTHAYLPCYVKQLGNKSVAWIRKEDSHIVTVDRYTFIADERFQVIAAPPGDSWILQIKYVQPRDGGIYECQISSEPKLAFPVMLSVLVPTIRMDTSDENMFVWEGSQVQLRCIVQDTLPENLGKILWFRNGQILNRNDLKNFVAFQSKIDGETVVETATFSAQKSQSGNYTCFLNSVGSASVTLHVLTGENPAAMHHGRGVTTSSSSIILSPSSTFRKLEAFLLIFLLAITSWNYNS